MRTTDYAPNCKLQLIRYDATHYELTYNSSDRNGNGETAWVLYGTKEEVLEELGEHMDNMKALKIECDNCREAYTEQELISRAWHCPNCKHKIGD